MELLLRYFPDLTPAQRDQFAKLGGLYEQWNEQINVISRKDIAQLYERHVLHSLGIAKVVAFQPGARVLDVGTGGGFPGVPLAILFPDAHFHLVDAIGKKIKVVREVSAALGLANVVAEQARAEQLPGQYDFVVIRAVTQLPTLVDWLWPRVRRTSTHPLPNGLLCLKGGDLTAELSTVRARCRVFELNQFFAEEFFETKKVVYVPVT